MSIEKIDFGVLESQGKASVKSMLLPELGEHDVLLRQEACNICTTDYQQWQGKENIKVILWQEGMKFLASLLIRDKSLRNISNW